ncbi:hypothetical protein [Nitrosomonas marina]|uniref:Uncharacterized protein n=1 Tax=Nitrosomonas marina TaxID=917 RepID=A0A1H8HTU5_9PROT|nr:hypothetical protein [Nitrosomonas marina]SEN59553.1 hypothetical protein SAMN05216325_12630 [Nitrosomonas marina]
MVSIDKENAYELREYIGGKVLDGAKSDPFKSCFVQFLGLSDGPVHSFDFASLSLYQKCAVSGLQIVDDTVSESDLTRLLGQASRIDSTPMPWVSDFVGVMSVKWLIENHFNDEMGEQFQLWVHGFVSQQIKSGRLSDLEGDIARYVRDSSSAVFKTATFPLFLHYCDILTLSEQHTRQDLISRFMAEFRLNAANNTSPILLALMVYCFDYASNDLAIVPPNGWLLRDLVTFLERIPVGLKRWTWEEEKGRTRNSIPVKWLVENEYHVQNLLYLLLAPIFDDIADEVNLQQVGQKNPRADLYLPGLHTIIEVKYRKDSKKSFSKLIGEVAEDASLYHADTKYKDARLVSFLWDHTRSTQEHAKFKEGVLSIQGVDACLVVSSPSFM